ncbi:hypothetical protein PR202_gb15773 [Eleusine coracana subsp. coracana]|uniref:DUF7054 domain-containing protein n=1 Tax=Eleusine coracana subsp. coracana TaxID=191504 RepID=A0AAV5EZ78_ELECO|nr:hypothetical protein QOZ80_4BG0350260 [Eleusine coracana subsp. coracana]GJN27727.1 hypothetical protein PR202_gb15773 [Eleusine coracana subsp. coracana]
MPPLATPRGEKSSSGGGRERQETAAWQRSASFHGSGAQRLLPKQRPKTQPDLLAGMRAAGASSWSGSPQPQVGETETGRRRRTPSKVLVSVSVQRSMWPLHVMASAEWRVADLVAAAVALYVKEGRRPQLPSVDPADFGLHFSQFSLESLDPSESVMELGSRSFFLCPKSSALGLASSSSSNGANGVIITEASGKAGEAPAWLSYMQFWPIM